MIFPFCEFRIHNLSYRSHVSLPLDQKLVLDQQTNFIYSIYIFLVWSTKLTFRYYISFLPNHIYNFGSTEKIQLNLLIITGVAGLQLNLLIPFRYYISFFSLISLFLYTTVRTTLFIKIIFSL